MKETRLDGISCVKSFDSSRTKNLMSHYVDCFLDYSERKLGNFSSVSFRFFRILPSSNKDIVVGGGFSAWLDSVCHVFTQIRSRYESLYAVKMLNLGTLGNLISSSHYFLMNS